MIKEDSLPRHSFSLSIEHNNHKDVHMSAAEQLAEWADRDFGINVRHDEWKQRMIDTNEIWSVQWYPNSSGSFFFVVAPTLLEAVEFAKEIQDNEDNVGLTYSPNNPRIGATFFSVPPHIQVLNDTGVYEHNWQEAANEIANVMRGAANVHAKDKVWNEFASFRTDANLAGQTGIYLGMYKAIVKIAGFEHACFRIEMRHLGENKNTVFLYLIYDKQGEFDDVFKYTQKA